MSYEYCSCLPQKKHVRHRISRFHMQDVSQSVILATNGDVCKQTCKIDMASFPVIPHGVSLSIGSVMPLDRTYLQGIKRISNQTRSSYYSEHLCMTPMPSRDIGYLAPLWFTEELLHHVIRQVRMVQEILEKPFILENVTYMLPLPQNTMSQEAFFRRLVEAISCGVLVDVTKVFINAMNHRFDPLTFLDHMPLDHLVQVHLAGGYWRNGWLVDGHSELVPDDIFALYQTLASRCQIKGVIFEHDAHFPTIEALLRQLEYARSIIRNTEKQWKEERM